MRESKVSFIRQQGIRRQDRTDGLYSALMFQPRVIGCVVALGVVTQSPALFLALAAVLWWSTIIPAQNPFDAFYNHVVAGPRQRPIVPIAPAPRRFAQGMSGTFALAIGVALASGALRSAWLLQGVFVGALMALIVGRFCLGSYLYHLFSRTPARHCSVSPGS